jgi:hypothetical protein
MYFSYYEKVVTICVVFLMLAVCLTANGLVLFFIRRDQRLHTPILVAIACHAFADFMVGGTYFAQALYTLSVGNTNHFNNYKMACFVERAVSVFWVLGQTQNLSVLAGERCIYFMYPYWYMRLISVRKILTAEITIYILAFTFAICTFVLGDSYYSVSLLHCSLYNVPWYLPVMCSVWFMPPALIVIIMVVKLSLLIHKQRHQIHIQQTQVQMPSHTTRTNKPNQPDQSVNNDVSEMEGITQPIWTTNSHQDHVGSTQPSTSSTMSELATIGQVGISQTEPAHGAGRRTADQNRYDITSGVGSKDLPTRVDIDMTVTKDVSARSTNISVYPIRMMKTTIKLVGCISLTLYLTYIPGIIVSFQVLDEISIIDLELGRYPDKYHLLRIFFLFVIAVSTIINPFFHFLFNRPLTRALYKLLRITIPGEWRDSST